MPEADDSSSQLPACETALYAWPVTEMRLFDLRVTVERIEGRSVCGLAVGDWFEVTESCRVRIPEGQHFLSLIHI